ncbi:hypothetical protein [Gordonia oryzae]|uniref:hypothetical protein n=1 Tax=Gordonia oryzae TaxID=2487349 RepID=UPI001615ECCF|nr:hypothetical protein [Gordonia oryzae]
MGNLGRDSLLAKAIAELQSSRNALANPPANAADPVGWRRMDANMNRLNREARPEGKQFSPSPVSATDWRSKSYDEMKKVKDSFDGKQGQLDAISIAWRSFGEKWASEMEQYNTAVSNITASSWVGDTAELASAAVSGFVGGFPESIRDYANEMSDRIAGLAANFRFAANNFPTIDGDTKYRNHEFTGETWFGLSDYYQHNESVDRYNRGWTWGEFLWGSGGESGFDTVKAMVDKVFKATSQASYLLANNYSTPLQESVQNLRHFQSAGAAPTGAPGGSGPGGVPQSGGGGTAGGGTAGGGTGAGGGGQSVSAPDLEKSLDAMMKKTAAQNVGSPSSDNPLSQVGNTASSMLSSLGSQASQSAQQAISQAQQTAEQLAQKTAGEVPNIAEPTGFPNGVTPVSSATPAGGGGGQGRGTGGGGGGSGAPSATNPPSERTTKTGTTKSTSTGARPSAGIAQTAQGTTGPGAGAPGAGGRGAGGGGDKVHKVLKALRTRVNGEEIAGPEISSVSAESAIEGDVNAAPGGDDGTRA